MKKQKKGFFTFIFSLIPGAGEMYMGFYKQGLSIMGAFFAVIVLGVWLNIPYILVMLALIWFYSFFHVNNMSNLPPDIFITLEDEIPFTTSGSGKFINSDKGRKILATIMIVIGSIGVLNLIGYYLEFLFEIWGYDTEWIWDMTSLIPQFAVAIGLVVFGIILIRGKKKELEEK